MEMKKWLNAKFSRREAVTNTAKLGAAVALSNAITLPFSTTARAEKAAELPPQTMTKSSGTAPVW